MVEVVRYTARVFFCFFPRRDAIPLVRYEETSANAYAYPAGLGVVFFKHVVRGISKGLTPGLGFIYKRHAACLKVGYIWTVEILAHVRRMF